MIGYFSSDADWCEDNHQVSYYIVEFMNSLSNLPILALGCWGFYRYYKEKEIYAELRWTEISQLWGMYFLIPLSSFYYHSTLSYLGQSIDQFAILAFLLAIEPRAMVRLGGIGLALLLLVTFPNWNRLLLLVVGIREFVYYAQEQFKVLGDNPQKIYFYCFSWMTFSLFFWIIDMAICPYLYISTHWIWHLASGIGMYQALVYLMIRRLVLSSSINLNRIQIHFCSFFRGLVILPWVSLSADYSSYPNSSSDAC